MLKKLIILFGICLFLFSITGAVDRDTPWKSGFGGNGYIQADHYNYAWLSRHMGYWMIAGSPIIMNALRDTAAVYNWPCIVGPYASSQEIDLYDGDAGVLNQIDARELDTVNAWLYDYATHYLDSVLPGVSTRAETLVVHIADDMISLKQHGDSSRGAAPENYSRVILTAGLNPSETRFTYQFFNNTNTDTFAYPMGYQWLANGFSVTTQKAIAYAFVRHFIEDSAKAIGPGIGTHPPTGFFSDNQYRNAASPRLNSYYRIDSTRGGPTSEMDWKEIANIESNQDSLYKYFDKSTGPIDTMIQSWLDAATTAGGLPRIRQCVNIDKSNVAMLSATLPFVSGVSLENPIGVTSNAPSWLTLLAYGDTMAQHLNKMVVWTIPTDVGYLTNSGTDTATWAMGHIGDISKLHLAFFACVQDTNAYVTFMRFNDSLRWYNIYEVDLGLPDAYTRVLYTFGNRNWVRDTTIAGNEDTKETDSTYLYIWQRNYDDSNNVVLLMTCSDGRWGRTAIAPYGTAFQKTVSLEEYYYPINANGETSATSVNSVVLTPYEAFIGTKKGIRPSTIIDRTVTSANANSAMNITFGIDDDNTICSLAVYFNDSLVKYNIFSGTCTAVGDMVNGDTVVPYTPICSDVGESHWIIKAFNSVGGARYDTNDITIGVANIVSPTLTTYAIGGTDTVDAISTVTYTLSGDLTFIADTLWFSKDGGVTYPIVFDYHTSEPTTGDTIMTRTITRNDTTQNGKFKLRVWSDDPTCGEVSKTVYSTGIMNYIWVDTTINYFGWRLDSGTTPGSQLNSKGVLRLWKYTTPIFAAGVTAFLDSSALWCSANGVGIDTVYYAIYKSDGTAGAPKTPLARSLDSSLTNGTSDAIPERLRYSFDPTTVLESNTNYWVGLWVYGDSTEIPSHSQYGVHFWPISDTTANNKPLKYLSSGFLTPEERTLPNNPSWSSTTTYNLMTKVFYHTKANYIDTVPPVIDSIIPVTDTFITGISNALIAYMSDTSANANAEERLASCTLKINNQYGIDTTIYDTAYGSEVRYITKVKDYLWRSQDTGNAYFVVAIVDTGGNVTRDSVAYLVKAPLTWLQKLGLKLLSIFGVSVR